MLSVLLTHQRLSIEHLQLASSNIFRTNTIVSINTNHFLDHKILSHAIGPVRRLTVTVRTNLQKTATPMMT